MRPPLHAEGQDDPRPQLRVRSASLQDKARHQVLKGRGAQ